MSREFAGRWISQVSHLLHVARGGITHNCWRVPDVATEPLSEEAAKVANSVKNIHKLTHGTAGKRFQAINYIPIHKFARDSYIVDYEYQASRHFHRKAALLSLESTKAHLEEHGKGLNIELVAYHSMHNELKAEVDPLTARILSLEEEQKTVSALSHA